MDQRRRHQRVKELFLAAVELPPEQRGPYLDSTCGEDIGLREEVQLFLSMDEDGSEELIDRPAVDRFSLLRVTRSGDHNGGSCDQGSAQPTVAERPAGEGRERRRPSRIGAYEIREVVAEGRSEAVYLAEQDESRRRVEIRLFDLRSAGEPARSRFEVERRSLTRITHPGIARVYETGTTEDGRAFLVTQLISGEPITEHCDSRELPVEERLQLFTEVCRSVHLLHQRGLVHRSIRPQNVLVSHQPDTSDTAADARTPVTRLRGFGLCTEPDGACQALSSMIRKERASGTPTFSAPELFGEVHGPDNDIRSDVYSLGMLLAELLVGRTTLGRRSGRHGGGEPDEDWVVLSARFGSLDEQTATMRSRSRGLDPTGMVRRLRGDLDRIVGRALAADIEERYGSAAELSSDVERHLRGLPLLAATETTEQSGVVRRRLYSLVAVLVVALVILAGLYVQSSLDAGLAQAAAETAADEAAVMDRASQVLLDLLESGCDGIDPESERIRLELADQPATRLRLLLTLGRAFNAAGCFDQAEDSLHQARALAVEVHGAEHPQVHEVRQALDELQRRRSRSEQEPGETNLITAPTP